MYEGQQPTPTWSTLSFIDQQHEFSLISWFSNIVIYGPFFVFLVLQLGQLEIVQLFKAFVTHLVVYINKCEICLCFLIVGQLGQQSFCRSTVVFIGQQLCSSCSSTWRRSAQVLGVVLGRIEFKFRNDDILKLVGEHSSLKNEGFFCWSTKVIFGQQLVGGRAPNAIIIDFTSFFLQQPSPSCSSDLIGGEI